MDVTRGDSFSVYCGCDRHDVGKKHYHTSVEWKIAHITDRVVSRGDYIVSPTFRCSNVSWRLNLYPYGIKCVTDFRPHLKRPMLYLNITDNFSMGSVTTYLKTTILNEKGNNLAEFKSEKHVFSSKCKRELVYADFGCVIGEFLLKQSTLTICFGIRIEENTVPDFQVNQPTRRFHDVGSPQKIDASTNTLFKGFNVLHLFDNPHSDKDDDIAVLCTDLETLHKNPRFADVVLKLGEHEFPAHKVILASRSKVFEAMFEHDMQENRKDAVNLVQMETGTVIDMLQYIYCGKVRQLSSGEALSLYVAADRYDLQGLVNKCRKVILSEISIDNICEISAVASLHNDQLLIDAVKYILHIDMKEVLKTEKWRTFSNENPVLALNLIQSVILSK